MDEKTIKDIKKELRIHSKALGIPPGAAYSFIDAVINSTKKALKNKSTITQAEIEKTIKKELKKYNPDLAYVYQNRDKII